MLIFKKSLIFGLPIQYFLLLSININTTNQNAGTTNLNNSIAHAGSNLSINQNRSSVVIHLVKVKEVDGYVCACPLSNKKNISKIESDEYSYEVIEKNLGFSTKKENVIYRLQNKDGSPWTVGKTPTLVDVSKKVIHVRNAHLKNFFSSKILKKFRSKNLQLFWTKNKANLDDFYTNYSIEEASLLKNYKKLPGFNVIINEPIIDLPLVAKYYTSLLLADSGSTKEIFSQTNKWLQYNYFTQEIIQNICCLLREDSYLESPTIDLNPVLQLLEKLLQSPYAQMHTLNTLNHELFLTDFVYCISSFITHSIIHIEAKEEYVSRFIAMMQGYFSKLHPYKRELPTDNYCGQLQLFSTYDPELTVIFKPLIENISVLTK